jgi:hypothetical protein
VTTTIATIDWTKPREHITALEVAFGPRNLSEWLPSYESIPEDFKRGRGPYCKATSRWFFQGLPKGALVAKPGINTTMALGHLKAVLGSFAPKHEHKEAGVAYLMSLWFEEPKL